MKQEIQPTHTEGPGLHIFIGILLAQHFPYIGIPIFLLGVYSSFQEWSKTTQRPNR